MIVDVLTEEREKKTENSLALKLKIFSAKAKIEIVQDRIWDEQSRRNHQRLMRDC